MELKNSIYSIETDDTNFEITQFLYSADNVDTIKITCRSKSGRKEKLPKVTLKFDFPHIDVLGMWNPAKNVRRLVPNSWTAGVKSSMSVSMPLAVLFSQDSMNRMTLSCSDAVNPVTIRIGLREEDAVYSCDMAIFDGESAPEKEKVVFVRIDKRNIRYEEAIADVVSLWEIDYPPMSAHYECVTPVYSTWYSFHQMAFADQMEKVIESARPLGFASVIVDDGWQMDDYSRTYDFCGDWEVAPSKIPDMRAHVKKVHDMDMKYFMWYSLPFVGRNSKAYERFEGKYLNPNGWVKYLDIRYPDVREYLISKLEGALKDWDVDGFKLDFIDKFDQPEEDIPDVDGTRDFDSVPIAVERFLTDVRKRLTAIKEDVYIEFRQDYMGPAMRQYANMFRAADCADDAVDNKVRTMDLRLTLGNTPVHSDMLTWNVDDKVEAACRQLQAVMFAVPQISVRPSELSDEHNAMLKDWLTFWNGHKKTLLSGEYRFNSPALLYPSASVEDEDCYIAVTYDSDVMLDIRGKTGKEVCLVNSASGNEIVVRSDKEIENCRVYSCTGEICDAVKIADGVSVIPVPPSGRVIIG